MSNLANRFGFGHDNQSGQRRNADPITNSSQHGGVLETRRLGLDKNAAGTMRNAVGRLANLPCDQKYSEWVQVLKPWLEANGTYLPSDVRTVIRNVLNPIKYLEFQAEVLCKLMEASPYPFDVWIRTFIEKDELAAISESFRKLTTAQQKELFATVDHEELKKFCPKPMGPKATMEEETLAYMCLVFKWSAASASPQNKKEYRYAARWHTKTTDRNPTEFPSWVVERFTKGAERSKEYLVRTSQGWAWVNKDKWDLARKASPRDEPDFKDSILQPGHHVYISLRSLLALVAAGQIKA